MTLLLGDGHPAAIDVVEDGSEIAQDRASLLLKLFISDQALFKQLSNPLHPLNRL